MLSEKIIDKSIKEIGLEVLGIDLSDRDGIKNYITCALEMAMNTGYYIAKLEGLNSEEED